MAPNHCIFYKTLHVQYQVVKHVTYQLILHRPVNKGKKIKCTLVQALRLCTGCMAHRGSKGIALLFLDHGIKKG
jgi:hypothetical protein